MSNVKPCASRFHAPGDFRARSCLSRVLCAMSSCVLSGIMQNKYRANQNKLTPVRKSHRNNYKHLQFYSVSNLREYGQHLTAQGSRLTEVFGGSSDALRIGTSIRKRKYLVKRKQSGH